MDRGRPGTVEMTKLGIALPEFHRRTVLETEAEAVIPDRFHRRDLSVGEPGGGIVAREAHLIATAKLQALAPKELDTALGRRDTAGFPFDHVAHLVLQMDGPGPGIDPRDLAPVVLFHAQGLVSAVEDHRVTRFVVLAPGHLRMGQPPRDELPDLSGRSGDCAFGDEPVPDRFVDPVAKRPSRRDNPGRLALFGGQGEPAFGSFVADSVRFRLRNAVSELGERGLHFAREAGPGPLP